MSQGGPSQMDAYILQALQDTLSADQGVRQHAESQLSHLSTVSDASLILVRITVAQEVGLAQRQSAVITLRRLVQDHWADSSYQVPIEVKSQVRPLLLQGLSDHARKIRSSCAAAVSAIARHDWPEAWPDLLSSLVHMLSQGNSDSVHGAMGVVREFVSNDVSEIQLLPVVRDLAPALLRILGNGQAHSASTRAETIYVFRQIVKTLDMVREQYPHEAKTAIDELLPPWLSAFSDLSKIDAATEAQQDWESLRVRNDIFRSLQTIQRAFPKMLAPHLGAFIQLAHDNLITLIPLFQTFYLSSDPDAPDPPSAADGTDDTGSSIPTVASSIIDFLTPASRTAKAAPLLASGEKGKELATPLMKSIVHTVAEYTLVTRENEEEWMDDPNAFLADDDEETEQYGLRVEGHDLVGAMMDRFPSAVAAVLRELLSSRVSGSAHARETGRPDWWKPLEGMLALLGGLADDLAGVLDGDQETAGPMKADIQNLLNQVVPSLLGSSDTPFLQGRAFVFASHFVTLLSPEMAGQYLGATVAAMEAAEVSITVKLSAVKTIKNFCRFVPVDVIGQHSRRILELLLPLLQATKGETLYLLIETIRAVMALDQQLLDENSIVHFADQVYATWEANSQDPVLTAIVEELLESVMANARLASPLAIHLSPKIGAAICSPTDSDTLHIPGEAVQLANSLIRTRGGPIEIQLVEHATVAIMRVLRATDDMDVIQHGMIHLTLLVRKDCDKLIQWRESDGTNGIAYIFSLLGRFLGPTFSESGGVFVGELIMHLFRKAGSAIAPVLPDLLRAIVSRIATAQLPSFIQSLVLPFAYLFCTEHTSSTIDLLSQFTVTGSDGQERSALKVVLAAWCETSETISGSWNIRVSDLGMAKLFALADPRVAAVVVKGDLVISDQNRNTIMTRSRTKDSPNQYTQIAFPVKALKLLLKDVQNIGKGKGVANRQDDEIDSDDGDEDWEEDDPLGDGVGEFDYLSSWLDGGAGEHDAQDDDEDLKTDPIAQIDLGTHLTEGLRRCYAADIGGMHGMVELLTDAEKGILRGVLTL